MKRRKFTIPADVRIELLNKAEDLTEKLVAGGLHRDDAVDAMAAVLGNAAEAAVEMAGAPDLTGDVVDLMVRNITKDIAEALRPDPEKVLKRATEALKAGNQKKAERLFKKAGRLLNG